MYWGVRTFVENRLSPQLSYIFTPKTKRWPRPRFNPVRFVRQRQSSGVDIISKGVV